MGKKYQRKAIVIILLAAMLLTILLSSCSNNSKDSSKDANTALSNIRIITEGFYAFSPSVTYDILDIEVDNSGCLYIVDKDKVLKINTKKQEQEELITGLNFCKKILVSQKKILLLDQGNEKSLLKIYNLKGLLLKEIELEANVIKMQLLDHNGDMIALLTLDDNRNQKINILKTECGELTSLEFSNVRNICSYEKNKLCIVSLGGPYTLEVYDVLNSKIIKSLELYVPGFADIAYNEKNKTLYYLSPSEIGTINPDTGIIQTVRQLDTTNMKLYARIETHADMIYVFETTNDELYCMDLKSPSAAVGISKVLNIVFTLGNADSNCLREAQARFINENPEVQVSYSTLNMSLPSAKVKIMAGDMEMDIISIFFTILYDLVASGAIADLSGFNDIVSLMKHEDVLDGLYDFSSVDGFLFGVPLTYFPEALKVNSQLKEELKMDLPDQNWTWQDFYEYAQKARQDLDGDGKKDTYIMRADKNYPLFLNSYLCKYVNRVTGKVDFNNELFISLLYLWKKMWDEDLIGPGSISDSHKPHDSTMFSISSADNYMGTNEYTYIPALSSEKIVYPTNAQFLCVSSTSKNIELAVKFLLTYMSKEVQAATIMSNNSYIYKDFSLYKKRLEVLSSIKPLNAVNEQIFKNALRHAVPMAYPVDLRIFIYSEVMPNFMSGKITSEEAAKQIQDKAEMMIRE